MNNKNINKLFLLTLALCIVCVKTKNELLGAYCTLADNTTTVHVGQMICHPEFSIIFLRSNFTMKDNAQAARVSIVTILELHDHTVRWNMLRVFSICRIVGEQARAVVVNAQIKMSLVSIFSLQFYDLDSFPSGCSTSVVAKQRKLEASRKSFAFAQPKSPLTVDGLGVCDFQAVHLHVLVMVVVAPLWGSVLHGQAIHSLSVLPHVRGEKRIGTVAAPLEVIIPQLETNLWPIPGVETLRSREVLQIGTQTRLCKRLDSSITVVEEDSLEIGAQGRQARWGCATTKIKKHSFGRVFGTKQRPQQLEDLEDVFFEGSNNTSVVIDESVQWWTHGHVVPDEALFVVLFQEPKPFVH